MYYWYFSAFSSMFGKIIDARVHRCSFQIFSKVSCASHNQSCFILYYLMCFRTRMLFYVPFIPYWQLKFDNKFSCLLLFLSAESVGFSFCVCRKFFSLSESAYVIVVNNLENLKNCESNGETFFWIFIAIP